MHKILIEKALEGDKKALNELVLSIQKLIYNLAVKMLWDPDEAKDASQEILIRVITHLGSFKGQSSFSSWVYKIATNYLLTHLAKDKKRKQLDFDALASSLAEGLQGKESYHENEGEQNMLVQEIKIGCTNGMLQCLDADHRASYILGDILDFNSVVGADIQQISPEAFRKRLSRARAQLYLFMEKNCGIAQPRNGCRCKKQIGHCISKKRIFPNHLIFARNGEDVELLEKINTAEDTVKLFQTNPEYEMPANALREIREILEIG